jgi:hypothetical protein
MSRAMPWPVGIPTQPDTAELTAAWHALRDRGYACVAGAQTLDEVLSRTTGGALVRLHARLLHLGLPRFRDESALLLLRTPAARRHTTAAAPRAAAPAPRPLPFDGKRAASGERADD